MGQIKRSQRSKNERHYAPAADPGGAEGEAQRRSSWHFWRYDSSRLGCRDEGDFAVGAYLLLADVLETNLPQLA